MKMKCTQFLLAALLMSSYSNAQCTYGAKGFGGADMDIPNGMVTDKDGNTYITGEFRGTASFGTSNLATSGGNSPDFYIAKCNSSGTVLWAQKAGDADVDKGNNVKFDSKKNVYATGYCSYNNTSFGSMKLSKAGNFIAKYDSSGNIKWVKNTQGVLLVIDDADNIYISGYYQGNTVFDGFTLTGSGLFIAKYNANGNFIWAKNAGTLDSYYQPKAMTIDAAQNVFLTGYFNNATFGGTTLSGNNSWYVAKYDSSGNVLSASKIMSLYSSLDLLNDIAVDASDNIYVTGSFSIVATFGNMSVKATGANSTFLAKYAPNGNLIWQKQSGGSFGDNSYGKGLCLDASGNIYLTGYFNNTGMFEGVVSLFTTTFNTYVAKYDNNGTPLWAVKTKGKGGSNPVGMGIDKLNNTYVYGCFSDTTTFGASEVHTKGSFDIFLAKYTKDGCIEGVGVPSYEPWHTVYSDSSAYYYGSVFFTDKNTGYVATNKDSILKTTDGGINWTRQYVNGMTTGIKSICFSDKSHGFIASGGYVSFTTDAGASWDYKVLNFNNNLYSIFFSSLDTGYAIGNNTGLYKTVDKGANWTLVNGFLSRQINAVFFVGNIGYIVGLNGDILKSQDGGVTFTDQVSGVSQSLKSIFFTSANNGCIVGNGVLLRTTNGGVTWTKILNPNGNNFGDLTSVYFLNALTGYAVGGSGTVIKTTDGGFTWLREPNGILNDLMAVHFNGTAGYAVGSSGAIIKLDAAVLASVPFVRTETNHGLEVVPNPFKNSAQIVIPNGLSECTVMVYDVLGKEVKRIKTASTKTITITSDNLESGLYIFTLLDRNNKVVDAGKFNIE